MTAEKPYEPADALQREVASGDARRAMEALRDCLADALAEARAWDKPTPPPSVAALSRELRMVVAELDGMPGGRIDVLDEMQAKRAARLAAMRIPPAGATGW